ncbi:MAG: transglycosylase SLT domain-containing protein [Burkholderiaceae bacterium]
MNVCFSRHTTAWWLTAIVTLIAPLSAAAQAPTPADNQMLDLRDAYRKGNRRALQAGLPKVEGHLLEPMAAYWEARLGLETASNPDVRAFLRRWEGTYYEDRLRNDWLLLLGARRDWSTFLTALPGYRMKDDRQVRCHTLHAQHATGQSLSAAEVAEAQRLWLAQKEAEEACAPLVDRLMADKLLPTDVAWERARQGAEFNRPRVVSQAVGLINGDWVATANATQSQPDKYLDEKLTAIRHRTKELVTLALVRLAATDPADAAEQMARARWRVQLTTEEKGAVWGAIGKAAAMGLKPEATGWFAKGRPTDMTADQLGWWVRAALRAGQWAQVAKAIAAMPEPERQQPVWVYWHARALEALKTPDHATEARALYQSIANPHHFYGQLALEELGQAIATPPAPAPLSAFEKHAALDNPGLQRALKAIAIGLRAEGVREWNYTTNLHTPGGMAERDLLAAADLACQHQVWDRCINTSERTTTEADHQQRYPTPHRAPLVKQANAIGLDPAYVYGLIRQESRFITDARSHVGASGLMQVMPATAKWTAKKIGLTGFQPHQITERDTNIAIGTGYLKLVLDDFEGSMPMAAAAYNAGPSRPRQWRAPGGSGPVLEGAIWAENIPFAETRDYVKRVLANTTNYAALITGQPQSLKARMGQVGPRSGVHAAVNTELP